MNAPRGRVDNPKKRRMRFDQLKRREFITLLGGAAAGWPLAVRAQQAGKTYRIGWLQPGPIPDPWVNGFRQGLQEFNYVEGKNLIIEYRWGDGSFDRLPAMAGELVGLNPDVIISVNTAALLALQKLTTTIPIVMLGTADPVGLGLVRSLARPGANITGMSVMAPELSQKRLEFLKEVVPNLDRVAVLSNPGNPAVILALQETQAAAQALGLTLHSVDVHEPSEIDLALSAIAREPPGALVLLIDTMIHSQRVTIVAFAVKHRLPTISPFREFAEAGGLMAYGPQLPDLLRRAVGLIDKILRGERPANLPVQQPTKFELVINLKTARALGLDVPPTLLARADEVIE
jgi:putative tryptophan/tyrosine transport system substrate-binding protein